MLDGLPETLPALVRRALAEPRPCTLAERDGDDWTRVSSEALLARVENLACALHDAGVKSGERVALISANRVDWIVADFAILFAGCVVVPIFPTQALDQVAFILEDSQAKLVFVDTPKGAERLRGIASLPPVVVFDGTGDDSLAALEARGRRARGANKDWPASFERELQPAQLAILMYTSGTTGLPKGVMLSHRNLVTNAYAVFEYGFQERENSVALSVLPFSHIYEHCFIYGYLAWRTSIYICTSAERLLDDLRRVRPVIMTSVPRLFERIIASIVGRAKRHGGAQAKLVPWALEVGRQYMTARTRGTPISAKLQLEYRLAHALVLRKLRPLLGLDRLEYFSSGSASLHFDTAMTFRGAGIEIVEGYGVTECSPVITCNRLSDNRYGTVGRAIPGVELRIADDGEILARGPNVMLGYYHDPVATGAAIEDGWYHTGDIGTLDDDGYLRVTDRKRELFKTSGGKFISPARVETALKRSVYFNQVMVVGDGRPHPIALVSPNWDLVCSDAGLEDASEEALASRPEALAFLSHEARAQTSDLAAFEQIRHVIILPRELAIDSGELTPTLKVKRRVVEERYRPLIEAAYGSVERASA